jgi:hypothetical protein
MKKAHIWLGLCLLLALAAFKQDSVAQIAPQNDVMAGKGLREAAVQVKDAIVGADYATVYDALRPAGQGRVELLHERFNELVRELKLDDEGAKNYADNLDPDGKLGITSLGELLGLNDKQFFGLASGLLSFAEGRDAKKVSLKWHLVEEGVGLLNTREMGGILLPWGGSAIFENRDEEQLTLVFTVEGTEWKLATYEMEIDGPDLDFERILRGKLDKDDLKYGAKARGPMSEGEQYLGSARDYCRVMYSKTGSEDDVTELFDKEIKSGAFDGEYYNVRNYHKRLPNSEYDAGLEAHPVNDSQPWGLIQFKWASGESSIEWFETKAELDERLAVLKEEQVKEPK